jgi:hypothetical protein
VQSTVEEVFDILADAPALTRWWPSVYLAVKETEPGDPVTRVGRVIDLYTKGWMPYTLRWSFRVTEVARPHTLALEAWGDFEGRGVWTLAQEGADVAITYDWRIRAEKPLLRYMSFMMRPLFSANHVWAMARGEESLVLEIARRAAGTDEERAAIAAPPPTTFAWVVKKA